MTELRGTQSQEQACDVRLQHHLDHPLRCIQVSAVGSTFHIDFVGRVMSKANCLAQEAIWAAKAIGRDPSARGACFSCFKLGAALLNTARKVRGAVRGLDAQAARDSVIQYGAGLDEDHPLRRHLEGKPYKDATPTKGRLPERVVYRQSGPSGHLVRQRHLAAMRYVYGGKKHRQLKRGVAWSAVVKAENSRRKRVRKSGVKAKAKAKAKAK
jgi:hypothetical protein